MNKTRLSGVVHSSHGIMMSFSSPIYFWNLSSFFARIPYLNNESEKSLSENFRFSHILETDGSRVDVD